MSFPIGWESPYGDLPAFGQRTRQTIGTVSIAMNDYRNSALLM
ncbi:hypothetical protein X728_27245 [Mesorhizobium sp. L103C120A0]|nr:hypothetical protein X728_27245 [Mesorhizobium sp. L103C120A0]